MAGTQPNVETPLTECPDGSFCCHGSNSSCCFDGSGIYLSFDGRQILYKTATNPNPGLKAGIGTVSAVAGILMAVLFLLIFRLKRIEKTSVACKGTDPVSRYDAPVELPA